MFTNSCFCCLYAYSPKPQSVRKMHLEKSSVHTSVAYTCLHYWHKSANDAEPNQTAPKGAAQHGPTTFDQNGNDNTADAKGRRLSCVQRSKEGFHTVSK